MLSVREIWGDSGIDGYYMWCGDWDYSYIFWGGYICVCCGGSNICCGGNG